MNIAKNLLKENLRELIVKREKWAEMDEKLSVFFDDKIKQHEQAIKELEEIEIVV